MIDHMTEIVQKQRIEYLDIAKGIGILLVVLGHCNAKPDWITHFVFSVHMPLFFILSGFTFSRKHLDHPGDFIKKSAKMLLVPYVISVAAVIVFQVIKASIWNGNPKYELIKWSLSGLYGSGARVPAFFEQMGLPVTFIGAVWFLLALFFARILLLAFLKTRTPALWVMICFFAGYITSQKIGWFPFSIQAGCCAVLFLYIGFLIREKDLFRWDAVHWVVKLLMLLIWVYYFIFHGRLWFVSNTFSDGFVDIIGSICGTFVIVYLSQGMAKIRLFRSCLGWLGKASLGIMCANLIVLDSWPISKTVGFLSGLLHSSYFKAEVIMLFAATALVTAAMYFIPWINRRMYPALFRDC